MFGSLVLLPLRLGVRAVELVLNGAADVLERIAGLAGAHVDRPPHPDAPGPDEPAPAEPAQLDVETELVEEVAEPGAQDGAGASVHVAEPWEGYRELRAADVVQRLGSASREELAAIECYELSHRNRRTVIAAAQRGLRRR